MEKLLSTQAKNKTNDASSLTGQRKKIFPLAMEATENIFCRRTANNFYNQPYSGCFILVNQ